MALFYQQTYILPLLLAFTPTDRTPSNSPPVDMQLSTIVTATIALFASAAYAKKEKQDPPFVYEMEDGDPTRPPPAIVGKKTSAAPAVVTQAVPLAQAPATSVVTLTVTR
ncbi:hypothetical protein G6011_03480 [Alternaria panax]|uniref:Uncharacterized protein n=1 Tax=Alternaria panax TaxID=48097 RepID=A0AAD4IF98_9PLEO|nr:hypothetical protein G6011_03480 [Alternaria panax]